MGGRTVSQSYGYSAISSRPETVNYAKDNLPVRYTMSSTRYIDYTYDTLNRLTGKTLSLATPLSYAYTYKASARGGNYATTQIATETIGNDVYSYTYDKLGNITSISLNGEEIRSFVYDRYNQLKRDNNKIANLTYYYNYDGYGNLTDKRTYEYTTGSLGERLSKTNYIYSGDTAAGWSKLLTEYDDEDIVYDAIGNPTKYRGAELTWETRQLKSYDKGNTSVTYKYDADGLRASKTVNGEKTTYQYVSGKLMYENRGGTEIYYSYDSYGAPTSIKYYEPDGTTYTFYLATNQQGDVIGIYNSNGNLVVKYEYDAWGNIISETNATGGTPTSLAQYWSEINPFRYRGYYYDAETGFYYVSSRYYDPEIGRFISQDITDVLTDTPMGLTDKNLFAYCDNNPVIRADYGGDFWHIVAGAAIGGLFELGSQLLSGEKVDLAKVGVATLAGGVTAAVGPFAGAAISGATNIALDMMSGEKDIKKLAVSGIIGASSSLVGSSIGKVVEKAGGKVATKMLGKMSRSKLKTTVTSLMPTIKGAERNAIKNISYLTSKYPAIGAKYFTSSHIGKTITTSIGQLAEGFVGVGLCNGKKRFLS